MAPPSLLYCQSLEEYSVDFIALMSASYYSPAPIATDWYDLEITMCRPSAVGMSCTLLLQRGRPTIYGRYLGVLRYTTIPKCVPTVIKEITCIF